MIRPSGKLSKLDYFKLLNDDEQKALDDLVPELADVAGEIGFNNLHIIAVGSSLWGNDYWLYMTHLAEQFPDKNLNTTYRNINLRLLYDRDSEEGAWCFAGPLSNGLKTRQFDSRVEDYGGDTMTRGRFINSGYIIFPEGRSAMTCRVENNCATSVIVEVAFPGTKSKPVQIHQAFQSSSLTLENGLANNSPGLHLMAEEDCGTNHCILYPSSF